MTEILVLGAGGIIGQHMMASHPEGTYVKRTPHQDYLDCDLSRRENVQRLLDNHQPTAVVNLAGENRVDCVDSGGFDDPVYNVNVGLPFWLARWCDDNGSHLMQVSTQGIFSGDKPPYDVWSEPRPITSYGFQKLMAENLVRQHQNWTIARVTFVLGVRPLRIGRTNPLESMFADPCQRQVNDRRFSVSFAKDVAEDLWQLASEPVPESILHLGVPGGWSRYEIACLANPDAEIVPVSDDDFPGPRRPLDTSWAPGARHRMLLVEGIEDARADWIRIHGR